MKLSTYRVTGVRQLFMNVLLHGKRRQRYRSQAY